MWETIFVFNPSGREEKVPKPLPPFTEGGRLMLWDTLKSPHKYVVKSVIYDLYSDAPLQYVYLEELLDV